MAPTYVFAVVLVLCTALPKINGYKEELKKTIASCQDGREVTDDEIEEFVKPLIPQTQEEKCLMACVFRTFNVISDGTFDKRIALAVSKDLLKSDPEKVKKITAVIDHCGDDIPKKMGNDCDLAFEIMQCYVKWEKEVGMI
uniref:Odorant-binding protein 17 n=1 Tax=Tropidothorax elegans TaxID=2233830 RepID=A0A2Z5EM87_9HEMI|nr:odorant-binding protein 17 [Tropidothorax elegans]